MSSSSVLCKFLAILLNLFSSNTRARERAAACRFLSFVFCACVTEGETYLRRFFAPLGFLCSGANVELFILCVNLNAVNGCKLPIPCFANVPSLENLTTGCLTRVFDVGGGNQLVFNILICVVSPAFASWRKFHSVSLPHFTLFTIVLSIFFASSDLVLCFGRLLNTRSSSKSSDNFDPSS